jgi:hypothetical protein
MSDQTRNFDFTMRGTIAVPVTWRLNDAATGFILPDGSQIRIFAAFEHGANEHYADINEALLTAFGAFDDLAGTEIQADE